MSRVGQGEASMRAAACEAGGDITRSAPKCCCRSRVVRIFFRCMFVRGRKHSRSISQLYSRSKLFTADSVPR